MPKIRSIPNISEDSRKIFEAISDPKNAHLFALDAALKAFSNVTPLDNIEIACYHTHMTTTNDLPKLPYPKGTYFRQDDGYIGGGETVETDNYTDDQMVDYGIECRKPLEDENQRLRDALKQIADVLYRDTFRKSSLEYRMGEIAMKAISNK